MKARAYIAVPLPPPATWRLLRDPRELPDGYTTIGSVEVGRDGPPALGVQTSAKRLRSRLTELEADGVSLEQWRGLFALFARMDAAQRRHLIEHATDMLRPGELVDPSAGEADG
jgi:hypothetical protein